MWDHDLRTTKDAPRGSTQLTEVKRGRLHGERGCLWIVVSYLELPKLHYRRPEILGGRGLDGHFVAVGMLES
jgi:hypothetical protein